MQSRNLLIKKKEMLYLNWLNTRLEKHRQILNLLYFYKGTFVPFVAYICMYSKFIVYIMQYCSFFQIMYHAHYPKINFLSLFWDYPWIKG